jgi:selenium-binding protein 1
VLDAETFDLRGRWEVDRGPQYLAYDFWWHLGYDTMITSEWGTPNMVENGVVPDLLLGGKYGHQIHVWDLDKRRHKQVLDLGRTTDGASELRPRTILPNRLPWRCGLLRISPRRSGGTAKRGGRREVTKVIEIPAEPAV